MAKQLATLAIAFFADAHFFLMLPFYYIFKRFDIRRSAFCSLYMLQ